MREVSEVVEDHIFKLAPNGDVHITYPDKHIIDLGMINPVQIGIQLEGGSPEGEGTWVVSLLTKEAVERLRMNITEQIELIGIRFKDYKNAIHAHNLLCMWILKKDENTEESDVGT